jgi:Flp pilus assembly protein TadG
VSNGTERDRGSITVETVAILPAIIVILLFVIGAVRLVHARTQIDQAADQAAIAAADAGSGAASQAATALLRGSSDCQDPAVTVARSGYAASSVTATVSCTVPLSDLLVAGFPGHRTVTAHATVPRSLYAVTRGDAQ